MNNNNLEKETLNNNNSKPITIQIEPSTNSSMHSYSLSGINHRPYCQYHQRRDSLSVHIPASLRPSIVISTVNLTDQNDHIDSSTTKHTNLEIQALPIPSLSSSYCELDNHSIPSKEHQCDCDYQNILSDKLSINNDEINEEKSRLSKYISSCFGNIKKYVAKFVASKYYTNIVLSAILMNTVLMGVEYHGQPQSLTNALEYSNLAFALLYAFEMILKIIADGFLEYIKNIYNLFDSGIVIISIIELHGHNNSGLSVLRTFRLLRVLKLVRYMPTLRQQLVRKIDQDLILINSVVFYRL